ncbi:hypothetical protein HWN78_27180, partial [Escherichia coli]|uniref:LamG-like jellyroll fold domain-containing protein n=1 Tax=Escherichia coli TaxID=562 RepID=UPI001848BF42
GTTDHLYVNGIEVRNGIGNASMGAGAQTLVFGDTVRKQFFKFSGSLDEISIYDHALSAAQVAAHYHAAGR